MRGRKKEDLKIETAFDEIDSASEKMLSARQKYLIKFEENGRTEGSCSDSESIFNQIILNQDPSDSFQQFLAKVPNYDLCFLLDITGSMENSISKVMEHIIDISNIFKARGGKDSRIGFVGYRDLNDKKRIQKFPFSTNVDSLKAYLQEEVKATGGDDECEDVNMGFQEILKLDWQQQKRMLIHIGDAPCHGSGFHNECKDKYPMGLTSDVSFKELINQLATKSINYIFFKLNDTTDKMFLEFQKIRQEIKDKPQLFLQINFNPEETDFIKNVIYATNISFSIDSMDFFQRCDPFVGQVKLPLQEAVVDRKPNWNGRFEISEKCEAFTFDNGKNLKFSGTIEMNKVPFGEGSFALAYYGKIKHNENVHNVVIKRAKSKLTFKEYQDIITVNRKIQILCKEFNKALKSSGFSSEKKLYFVPTTIIQIQSTLETYIVEAYISGKYIKYTNNACYQDDRVPIMTAFSHFSFEKSDKKYMATDLQGVDNILTDPILHTSDQRYSRIGDLGCNGIYMFLANHKCNTYCQKLQLKERKVPVQFIFKKSKMPEISFNFNKSKKCLHFLCANLVHGKTKFCDGCNFDSDDE